MIKVCSLIAKKERHEYSQIIANSIRGFVNICGIISKKQENASYLHSFATKRELDKHNTLKIFYIFGKY